MPVRFVACLVLLPLLCSCRTQNWYTPAPSIPRLLPNEIAFTELNGTAGRGGNLFLTLRLEDGQELAFMVDTGSPVTVLDKSLVPKLGERVATGDAFFLQARGEPAHVYRAPPIYLGNTRLLTGRWVITENLTAMTGGPLGGILGSGRGWLRDPWRYLGPVRGNVGDCLISADIDVPAQQSDNFSHVNFAQISPGAALIHGLTLGWNLCSFIGFEQEISSHGRLAEMPCRGHGTLGNGI